MRGSGGGSRFFRAKARPHFFADLDLSSILQPADPKEGSFVASKVGKAAKGLWGSVSQVAETYRTQAVTTSGSLRGMSSNRQNGFCWPLLLACIV